MAQARKKKSILRKTAAPKPTTRRASKKTTKKKVTRKKTVKRRAKRAIESREDGVRLNKYLADHGIASRRAVDELISEGRVTVDGVIVEELGLKIDPDEQVVELNGERIAPKRHERKQYYLLNKPTGVVCTNERRETRPRAIDLITDRAKGRIYSVGRLDEASKGLIILTNDGEFANRLTHPRYGVTKTYMVKLRGRITDEGVQKIREGVYLAEGRTGQARVVVRKRSREYSHLMVILREGKNREIRRTFHSVGFKVVELRRSRVGSLTDRGLKVGYWRKLTPAEVDELLALSRGEDGEESHKGAKRKKTTRRTVKKKVTRRGSGR